MDQPENTNGIQNADELQQGIWNDLILQQTGGRIRCLADNEKRNYFQGYLQRSNVTVKLGISVVINV